MHNQVHMADTCPDKQRVTQMSLKVKGAQGEKRKGN